MKKISLSLILLLFMFNVARSQNYDDAFKDIFLDGEFFLYAEEYPDALPFYQRIYNRGFQENANINYRIGVCLLNISGKKEEAIPYLEKAAKKASISYKEGLFKQDLAPVDVFAYLGNAYRINNRLDDAINAYQKYKSKLNDKALDEKMFTESQITACMVAKQMTKAPVSVHFTNAGEIINSASKNYNAVLSGDGNSMIYMFELPFYDAVYYSNRSNGSWSKPRNITPEIVSDGDMYAHSLSFDGKTLLLTKEDVFNSDIWYSELNAQGNWIPAQPISKNINSKFWESHASLSPDGKKLYFTSNRRDGHGEMDIYVSTKGADDWGLPKNIGKTINTQLNEDCPVFTPDGKYLFFSSQGHKSMGGYDIFYCGLKSNGTWTEPVNVGYPLNTTDDDLFYYPMNLKEGYISIIGENTFGKEDIYFVSIGESENLMASTENVIMETLPIEEETELVEEEINTPVENATNPEEVIAEVIPVKNVIVEAKIPVVENISINVSPILFEFNSSTISADGVKNVREIVELLKKQPEVKIELYGYTDEIGNSSSNLMVSQRRSDHIRNYLIKNGIEAHRITSTGKGETNFIAINKNPNGSDNANGRYYNRRVDIKLKNTGSNITVNYMNPVPNDLKIK